MKKIIASGVGLMLLSGVAVTGAMAAESQFGGMWRTRAYFMDDFANPGSSDNITDTRTRLYYTAKFADHFKFVNRFEMDSEWGDSRGGDVGADSVNIEVKNSYLDYTMGMVNTKLGIQSATIARGFIFSADFSGAVVTADFGMVSVPVLYGAVSSEDVGSYAAPANQAFVSNEPGATVAFGGGDGDVHLLSVMPKFKVNDNVSITPHVTWATVTEQDTDIYYLGIDADMKFDSFSAWGTFIYNGGEIEFEGDSADISAYLVAAGADAGIVHGQAFYSSGTDVNEEDDVESLVLIGGGAGANGASYYWSEIMGAGVFDGFYPDEVLGDKISNIWALNAGVTLKPMDKVTANFDVWYAQLAEAVLMPTATNPDNTEDELGLEFDARVTYALEENLNVDFIFAYLVAGDAIGEDIMEGGIQVSLAF